MSSSETSRQHHEEVLSNAHVAVVLDQLKKDKLRKNQKVSAHFLETLAYAERFSGVPKPTDNRAVIQGLATKLRNHRVTIIRQNEETVTHSLTEKEIAAISNLTPETPEEAVCLIPSLKDRFSEAEIRTILRYCPSNQGSFDDDDDVDGDVVDDN